MGIQFENLTYSSTGSLTLAIDDALRHQRDAVKHPSAAPDDLGAWLNALHRQSTPLIQSSNNRAELEAWLEAVDRQLDDPGLPPRA